MCPPSECLAQSNDAQIDQWSWPLAFMASAEQSHALEQINNPLNWQPLVPKGKGVNQEVTVNGGGHRYLRNHEPASRCCSGCHYIVLVMLMVRRTDANAAVTVC
jgi:hypothetical protein